MANFLIDSDKAASVQMLASTFNDDVPPDARRTQPNDWGRYEEEIIKNRVANCQKTLQSILGGSSTDQPRVGIAFSGGGWRAMASGVALLDALSVPIKGRNGDRSVKLIDTVSHAFGLSGGSWALMVAIAGGNDRLNPFHHHKDKVKTRANPWLFGQEHAFSNEVHQYDGLVDMVSEENVNAALERCGLRKILAKTLPIDTAVASAALFGSGTKVETWGHFLAGNLLNFLEDGDATNGSEKFKKKLSSLQGIIKDGSFPLVVCSAIANTEKATANDSHRLSEAKQEAAARLYNWIEISPFFLRNPTTRHFTEDVDTSSAYFLKGFSAEDQPDARRNDLRLHQVMGACGSAIAFDSSSLGSSISSPIARMAFIVASTFVQTHLLKVSKETPILHGTLTGIGFGSHPKAIVNCCRDAGIDINVPFPSVFNKSSGRQFDVVLVMDAGQGSKGAGELAKAVNLGYVTLEAELDPFTGKAKNTSPLANGLPTEDFGRERVKVYKALDGTIIIYFLGLTERPTSTVILDKKDLLKDVEALRKSAAALQPILLNCLKLKSKSANSNISTQPANATTTFNDSKSSPTMISNMLNPFKAAGATELSLSAVYSPNNNGLSASYDESPASPTAVQRMGMPVTFKKSPNIFQTPASQYFIKAWSAKGNMRFTLDTFNAVDDVLDPLGERWWQEVICEFEREAVAMMSQRGDTDAFLLKLWAINKRMLKHKIVKSDTDFFQGLVEVGILQRKTEGEGFLKASEITHQYLRYAPEWVDFYATTSIARHFVPTGSELLPRLLDGIDRTGYNASSSPADLEKIRVHNFLRSRFCMYLGSLVSKAKNGSANVDILKSVSGYITEQYLEQLRDFDMSAGGGKGGLDVFEMMVMHMASNLCDFFTEMMTYDRGLNLKMELDGWQQEVLIQFVNEIDTITQALVAKSSAYKGNFISATRHVLLIAEAVAKSTSLHSYMLMNILCAKNIGRPELLGEPKWQQVAKSGQLRQSLGSNGDAEFQASSEYFLRVLAAVYEAGGCKEESFVELLAALSPNFSLSLLQAAEFAFPGAIRRLFSNEVHQIVGSVTTEAIRGICAANGTQAPTAAPYAEKSGTGESTLNSAQKSAILSLAKTVVDKLYNATSSSPVGSQRIPYRRLNDNEFFYRSLFSLYDTMYWDAKMPSADIHDAFKDVESSPIHKFNFDFFTALAEAGCDDQTLSIVSIGSGCPKETIDKIIASARRYRRFIRINITREVVVTGAQQRDINAINDKAAFRTGGGFSLCCFC